MAVLRSVPPNRVEYAKLPDEVNFVMNATLHGAVRGHGPWSSPVGSAFRSGKLPDIVQPTA
jgi:hypothetical protein